MGDRRRSTTAKSLSNTELQRLHMDERKPVSGDAASGTESVRGYLGHVGHIRAVYLVEFGARVFFYVGDEDSEVEVVLFLLRSVSAIWEGRGIH